jgi:PncC family amidohydrolase
MSVNVNNMRYTIDKEANNIVQLLREKNLTLSTAESCTGGLLSGSITEIAGSSAVFGYGLCAYDNDIKEKYLGVSPQTLKDYGAVSAKCAAEMAAGARKCSGADIGVSVTGIAGPDGGTADKPVGTVYFACTYQNKINILHLRISGQDRQYIRLESVRQALILITNTII